MPTPSPPSFFWFLEIDEPLEQDADYEMTDQDRAYIDSQILALETVVLALLAQDPFRHVTADYASADLAWPLNNSNLLRKVYVNNSGPAVHAQVLPANPLPGQRAAIKLTTGTVGATQPMKPAAGQIAENPYGPGQFGGVGVGWTLEPGTNQEWEWGWQEATWFLV